MSDLLLKQELKSGESRTWKLKPSHHSYSFGSSRHADIISLSPLSEGIEAVFEFRNESWHLINLSENLNSDTHISDLNLNYDGKIQFKDFQFQFIPSKKEKDLLEKILSHSLPKDQRQQAKTYQLFLIKHGDQMLEVKIHTSHAKFKGITPTITEEWIKHKQGDYEIWEKTVYLNDNDELLQFKNQELIDEEMKKPMMIIISISILFFIFVTLLPSEKSTPLSPPTRTKEAQRIIVKLDKKPTPPKAEKRALPAPQPIAENVSKPGDPSKSISKSLSIGRVSQLIGKVSSRSAKSSVLLLGKGLAAGSTETGMALAAIGKLNKKGSDWGSQANASKVQISTGGKGGGNNVSGLGTLSAGSTGQANVGLIEEETEVNGGLDKEVIAQYIKSQLGQILYCYERQLSANPNLYGKVSVKFTIGSTGGVETQKVNDTTLKSSSVESCILNKISYWKFPTPQGGTRVVVTYPFLFKSTN